MAYNIISPNNLDQKTNPIGLGVSYISYGQLFKEISIDIDQAYENLKNLLLTRIGERILQPTFGTRLFEILFQPNVFELKELIHDIISEPVDFWLPYIILNEIEVTTNEDDPNLIHNIKIKISFSLNDFDTKTITITASDTGVVEVE
jgi:phage baseplate assembly protein W